MIYVIVDIETTGGNKNTGRITEIAAFKHDGQKVIGSFQSLVNPGRPIPEFVQNLTGISDEMVAEAPPFEEIADEFDKFTANSIFIAHNVNFDYRFLREEFRRIGKDFTRKKMCTVQLSRKAFPGLPSYSLGKITKELSIELNGHHRAAIDAEATTRLFEKIIQKESQKDLFDLNFGKPDFSRIASPLIDEELIDSIPDESGVFRLYDKDDHVIYVKRSQHILTDVCKKLSEVDSESGQQLLSRLYRIDWSLLGSDLIAQLEEAHEVITKRPEFNAGKFSMKPRFAAYLEVENEEITLSLQKIRSRKKAELFFSSFYEGLDYFKELSSATSIELDFVKNGKHQTPTLKVPNYDDPKDLFPENEFYVFDEGRSALEESFILVKGTHVIGYGFAEESEINGELTEDDLSKTFSHLPHLELVMRTFIQKGRYQRILELD
ncbi:MAG: exonuclease domain-containing protein [Bacteroidota bacterium]